MADQNLIQLTQISEAEQLANILLYTVIDPAGTELDRSIPLGSIMPEFYKISAAVSSNNLTVKLTHLDGTDPTVAKPLVFKVGDTFQLVTDNLQFTLNAGTNWMNLGASETAGLSNDLFVYVIEESGAAAGTKLGIARVPYGNSMSDFNTTNTHQQYIAGGYTTNTGTDPCRNIGRIRVALGAAASYNWSIPSARIVNFPIFETAWLNWTPTFTGFSANPTDMEHRYKLQYSHVLLLERENTDGTSNSAAMTFTAPFTAKNVTMSSGVYTWNSSGSVRDNSANVATAGLVRITANTNIVDVYKDMAVAGFTTSGGKRLSNMNILIYEL